MPSSRPRRSVLYVPGVNERALAKLPGLAVDVVILDLEDSVAPHMKAEARDRVAAVLGAPRRDNGPELVVRINALAEGEGAADLAAVLPAAPDGVLLPKVAVPDDLAAVRAVALAQGVETGTTLWAMIETARSVADPLPIALAQDGVLPLAALVLGLNDLSLALGTRLAPGRAAFLPLMMGVLAAARAGGLDVIDAVHNDIGDLDGLAAECAFAADCGFDGKSLIHPAQIEIANRAFAPSDAAIAAAEAIVDLFDRPENRDRGVVAHDGRMVERLHAEAAGRLLARARTIARRAGETARDM
ncbi:CoA ester lyase [Kaistia geumhonensis]|uniref:Citrate lyase subunit beta/citryl-CoA lyase n=1 Tax=Kaistia geumhonensis TaxID=410839 RepID=A0ABU0M8B1_9HYPH|nr:CoA ester lyase [Kaistia geumhonensis]MCX5477584.1 CoA ester lyase [Kaistia geumhonensis]MDQ0517208.1 citrate lyase subunit beta/citryl-CoA lyase [Kaistia geumhonensis]